MADTAQASSVVQGVPLHTTQIFSTLTDLIKAVDQYVATHDFTVKKHTSDPDRYRVSCQQHAVNACPWEICGQLIDKNSPSAIITKMSSIADHVCGHATSPVVAAASKEVANNSSTTGFTPVTVARAQVAPTAAPVLDQATETSSATTTTRGPRAYKHKVGCLRWIGAIIKRLKVDRPKMTAREIQHWIIENEKVDVPLQRVFHANRKMYLFYPDEYPDRRASNISAAHSLSADEEGEAAADIGGDAADESFEGPADVEMSSEPVTAPSAIASAIPASAISAPEPAPPVATDTPPAVGTVPDMVAATQNQTDEGPAPGSIAWLRPIIKKLKEEMPNITGKQMQQYVEQTAKVAVPIHRIFQCSKMIRQTDASLKAEGELEDETAATYALLPEYCRQLVLSNPGSVAQVCVKDAEDDFEFSRIFVSLHCLAEAFKHCRRLICLQSIPLQGPRNGHLLVASMVDANDHVLPLAWAVSQQCIDNTWKWFLELLKASLSTLEAPLGQLTFMLEVDEVLADIVTACFPDAYAAYCFDSIKLHVGLIIPRDQRLFTRAAMATNECEFARAWQELQKASPSVTDQLEMLSIDRWVDLNMPNNERLGVYNLSVAQDIFMWIQDKHDLPAYRLLQVLQFKTAETLSLQRIAATQRKDAGKRCTERATNRAIESSSKRSGWSVLANMSETLFTCTHATGQVRRVFWEEHKCDCGQWQQRGIPCEHAAAVLSSVVYRASKQPNVDFLALVNDRFSAATWHMTFQYPYEIVPSETLWPLQTADEQLLRAPPLANKHLSIKRKEIYVEQDEGELTIDGMTEQEARGLLTKGPSRGDWLDRIEIVAVSAKGGHKRQRSVADPSSQHVSPKKARLGPSQASHLQPFDIAEGDDNLSPVVPSQLIAPLRQTVTAETATPASVKRGPGRPRKIRPEEFRQTTDTVQEAAHSPVVTHAKKKRGPVKGWKQAQAAAEAERAHSDALAQQARSGVSGEAQSSTSIQGIRRIRLVDSNNIEEGGDETPAPKQRAKPGPKPGWKKAAALAEAEATAGSDVASGAPADASQDESLRRPRGRPPGPKTLALRAALAKENAERAEAGLPPLEEPKSASKKKRAKPVKRGRGRPKGSGRMHAASAKRARTQEDDDSQALYKESAHYSGRISPEGQGVQESNVRGQDISVREYLTSSGNEVDVNDLDREALAAQFIDEESDEDDSRSSAAEEPADASWRGSEPQEGASDDEDGAEDSDESEDDEPEPANGNKQAHANGPRAPRDSSVNQSSRPASTAPTAQEPSGEVKKSSGSVLKGSGMFRRYELVTEPRNQPWKSLVIPIEPEPGKVRATRQHNRQSAEPSVRGSVARSREDEDEEAKNATEAGAALPGPTHSLRAVSAAVEEV